MPSLRRSCLRYLCFALACVCPGGLAAALFLLVFISQLSFISAQQHKHHVQEIMLSAPSEPMMGAPKGVFMRPLLGVLYDEECRCVECLVASLCHAHACRFGRRKHWADKSEKLGSAFSVEALIAQGRNELLLAKARTVHNTLFPPAVPQQGTSNVQVPVAVTLIEGDAFARWL